MDALFKQISISKLARYAYPGLLVLLLLYICDADATKLITKENAALMVPAIFIFGTSFYLLFRYIIGEFIIFRLANYIHGTIDGNTNPEIFLKTVIKRGESPRRAYTYIRHGFFTKQQTENLDYFHTEIYLLYVNFVIGFPFIIVYPLCDNKCLCEITWRLCLIGVAAVISLIAAFIVDIEQHEKEGRLLKYGTRKHLLEDYLKKYGMISETHVH